MLVNLIGKEKCIRAIHLLVRKWMQRPRQEFEHYILIPALIPTTLKYIKNMSGYKL